MRSPTLLDVADQIRSLVAGAADRRDVSLWARRWLTTDEREVDDLVVLRFLERLGAADLRGGETEFLYYDIDFHNWLDEVEEAIEGDR